MYGGIKRPNYGFAADLEKEARRRKKGDGERKEGQRENEGKGRARTAKIKKTEDKTSRSEFHRYADVGARVNLLHPRDHGVIIPVPKILVRALSPRGPVPRLATAIADKFSQMRPDRPFLHLSHGEGGNSSGRNAESSPLVILGDSRETRRQAIKAS